MFQVTLKMDQTKNLNDDAFFVFKINIHLQIYK